MNAAYVRYELVRTFRNRRFLIFSFGFPIVLFYLIAGPNKNVASFSGTGLSAPLYYMIGLAAFGSMNAMLSAGARISSERANGWQRQLRTTPLSVRTYFRAKVLTAYAVALSALVLLYFAGTTLGVRLGAGVWWHMTWLIAIGLIPFAVIGITIGHLVSSESIGPVMGGTTALFAFLGGTWFPITGGGVLHSIAEDLPSYWLVQASHVALGGGGWGARGFAVVAVWTAAFLALARLAYRRDTNKQ